MVQLGQRPVAWFARGVRNGVTPNKTIPDLVSFKGIKKHLLPVPLGAASQGPKQGLGLPRAHLPKTRALLDFALG